MRIVYALLLSLWASVSVAQERDIQAVITQQIEAFQVDDFAQAFTYASPNIQAIGEVMRFLLQDCCKGNATVQSCCGP